MRKWIFFLLLLVVGALFGYRQYVISQQSPVESAKVAFRDFRQELTLSGKIEAKEHVALQFQAAGQLSYVGVKEGDVIKKNQVIASLDQRQLRKTFDKYMNTYAKSRNDLDQTIEDIRNVPFTDKVRRSLEKAQADLQNAVRDVELQNITLQYASLVSPIDGLVTRVDTPLPGVHIAAADEPFEIVNPESIYFQVNADQTEVSSFSLGQRGRITFDASPEKVINGIISHIAFSPNKDESGTVYKVNVSLEGITNNTYTYRLGMTGDITFTVAERKHVLTLPVRFVKSDNGKKYVFLGQEKRKAPVVIGLETDTFVEIISGIVEGDSVYD